MKTEKTVTTGSLTSEIIFGLVHTIEKRTSFGHLRHDSCTVEDCDFLYREWHLEQAKNWLKMHEQISSHEENCGICKNNGYGVATQ